MTQMRPKTEHPLRKLTVVAISLNAVASAGFWVAVFAQNTDTSTFWALDALLVALPLSVAGICVTIVACTNRGVNLLIGLVGGVILLLPVAVFFVKSWALSGSV